MLSLPLQTQKENKFQNMPAVFSGITHAVGPGQIPLLITVYFSPYLRQIVAFPWSEKNKLIQMRHDITFNVGIFLIFYLLLNRYTHFLMQ